MEEAPNDAALEKYKIFDVFLSLSWLYSIFTMGQSWREVTVTGKNNPEYEICRL
jgi:hypothetical protein